MVFSIELSKSIKSCRIIRRRGDDTKSIIKLMVVFVCVVSLVACGKKDTTVSANKDGVLYEAGVGVSFYYPSDFKLSEGNPNDGVTRFTKENRFF